MNVQSSSKKQIRWVVITSLIIIVGTLIGNYFLLIGNNDKSSIGSMFGVASALFSGLAFGGIIYTILLQRNELELQRHELRQTREEFVEQNQTLKQQRFENTFFNMLNLQSQIVQGMKFRGVTGKEVIDDAANNDLKNFLNSVPFHRGITLDQIAPDKIKKIYDYIEGYYHEKYYDPYETHFNHYFRHLYHIFKFIYFSDLTKEEKDFYAALARAQLSQNELLIIAFNSIIDSYGHPRFLYLMKEYDILKNFRWHHIWEVSHRYIIKEEMNEVPYPFNRDKPKERNVA
jgi:hypothetical protein